MKRVRFTEESIKELRSLHIGVQRRIKQIMKKVAASTTPGKKLGAELVGYESISIGDYRAVYSQTDSEITVVAVGHRRAVYRHHGQ